MICLAKSIPIRFKSITRSNIPTIVGSIFESPPASSAKNKIAVTPQGVTMVGMARGVTAGCLGGEAGGGAERLNCPIISREARNRRMPPAIRKSSTETRHDAAKPVIAKAMTRETAIAAIVPLIARARTASGV